MNNSHASKLFTPEDERTPPSTPEREILLVRLLEAIDRVMKDWQFLRETVLPVPDKIQHKILTEAKKEKVDTAEIYRLQGHLASAKRHDLEALAEVYRLELTNIRTKNNV